LAQVVLATNNPEVEAYLSDALLGSGHAIATVANWARTIQALADTNTKLLFIDGALPRVNGSLLVALAEGLPHRPKLVTVGTPLPSLEAAPNTTTNLRRMISTIAGPVISSEERKYLRLVGIGRRPLHALNRLARSPLPLFIEGERGSGKKQVAEAVQKLMSRGEFYEYKHWQKHPAPTVDPSETDGARGVLYLALGEEWDDQRVADALRTAKNHNLRLVVASRKRPSLDQSQWLHVILPPLRERREDLHELTLHYINIHRTLLGFPRRRFGKTLWALIYAYAWPGNARELETFVATTLATVERATIHSRHLPDQIRELIDPRPDRALLQAAQAFETTVEDRLRHVVRLYTDTGVGTLHQMVIDGAERPLFRLALARAGNQKAAAILLGVSRNTLRTHMKRLGLNDPGRASRKPR